MFLGNSFLETPFPSLPPKFRTQHLSHGQCTGTGLTIHSAFPSPYSALVLMPPNSQQKGYHLLLQILCWQGKAWTSQLGRQCLPPSDHNLFPNLIPSFARPYFMKQMMGFHISMEFPLLVILSFSLLLNISLSFQTKLILPFIGQTVSIFLAIPGQNSFLPLCAYSILCIPYSYS